jgi:hypothetical protein
MRRDDSESAYAVVDELDFDAVSKYRWWLHNKGYAARREGSAVVLMHRQILGLTHGDGRQCDHRNFDKLDNRRSNLRVGTHAENGQNVPAHTYIGSSQFRGVVRDADKWIARAKLSQRAYYLGAFDNELDAALAAEAFRAEHMPFAQPDPALQEALNEAEQQAA